MSEMIRILMYLWLVVWLNGFNVERKLLNGLNRWSVWYHKSGSKTCHYNFNSRRRRELLNFSRPKTYYAKSSTWWWQRVTMSSHCLTLGPFGDYPRGLNIVIYNDFATRRILVLTCTLKALSFSTWSTTSVFLLQKQDFFLFSNEH